MSEHKIQVAVVDDDESFARAIGRLLRAAGFGAVVYPSAEAFLQGFKAQPVNCLVLDIHLGGMSGFDLRRHLTAEARNTPVIFITAHDEPDVREEARRSGCAGYFRKPVPGRLLVEAIVNAANLSQS